MQIADITSNALLARIPEFKDYLRTEEHLVPVTQQGSNHLDNIVLAHFECNRLASHKSLVEKVLLRDQLRKPK